MKENVRTKIIAFKKGTPPKKIEKVIRAAQQAWEEVCPGETLCCIAVEVDDKDMADLLGPQNFGKHLNNP